jgi:nucleotide-binding universal stress UspA family protein
MKSIVVPTDLSVASEGAMMYAAGLASAIKAPLFLVHIYQMPIGMIDAPVIVVSPDELKKNTDSALEQAKETILKSFPEVEVNYKSTLGDVVTEINNYSQELEPLAFVIGIKDLSGIERWLFGNTASSIIRHVKQPVISVAANIKYRSTNNIVLATDLQKIDEAPVDTIVELVKAFNARLHIVHIQNSSDDHASEQQQLATKLKELDPQFETVTDENIIHGLQTYVTEHNIDMLLILPHKHNLYERLFFTLHSEDIVEKMPIPVISINTNA